MLIFPMTLIVIIVGGGWLVAQRGDSGDFSSLTENTVSNRSERVEFTGLSPQYQSIGLPSAHQISQSALEKERLIREKPNDYYDPKNKNPVYLSNFIYYGQIKLYLLSSRRSNPKFRKIMKLLLEYGYDVEEWREVVGILRINNMPAMHCRLFRAENPRRHCDQRSPNGLGQMDARSSI